MMLAYTPIRRLLHWITPAIEDAGCRWETGWNSGTGEEYFRVIFPNIEERHTVKTAKERAQDVVRKLVMHDPSIWASMITQVLQDYAEERINEAFTRLARPHDD